MLSFIIPAHNEESLLPRTLRALDEASRALPEPAEVVVADDSSTDRTADVARAHGARVVRTEARQIAAARNAGARAARGDLLVFVDADTVVPAATAVAALRALRAGAVGGGCVVDFDRPLPLWSSAVLPVFIAVFRAVRIAAGCFLFCSRDAFDAAGGWDETLFASEEVTMSHALRQLGRFVVLRERVITSGRKLRAHSPAEILRLFALAAIRGKRLVRSRKDLSLWYAPRRVDPHAPPRDDAPRERGPRADA